MGLSRKTRGWITAFGSIFVPMVVEVSGIQGFGPVLFVCVFIILWTLFFFREDISRLRVVQDPSTAPSSERPFWLILPGIAMLLFALFPFVSLYQAAVRHIEPLTFQDLLQSYIHDRSIYMSDLARTEAVIRDRVFENVTFVGPAFVSFIEGNSIRDSSFEVEGDSQEAMLLTVPNGTLVSAAIGFKNCVFRNCRFVRIQVIGLKEDIDRIRDIFTKHAPAE